MTNNIAFVTVFLQMFFFLFQTCAGIEELKEKRRDKLAEQHLTVQPYIIVVGKSFCSVTESYVIIEDNTYKSGSVLQSLDFIFKAFHALHAEYPKESEHIHVLLERAIYKIQSDSPDIPAVMTLVKELENI